MQPSRDFTMFLDDYIIDQHPAVAQVVFLVFETPYPKNDAQSNSCGLALLMLANMEETARSRSNRAVSGVAV